MNERDARIDANTILFQGLFLIRLMNKYVKAILFCDFNSDGFRFSLAFRKESCGKKA